MQSIDEYWNTFSDRQPSLNAFRGAASQGAAQNELGFWGYAADIAKAVPRGVYGAADSITEMLYYGTGGLIGNNVREAPFGVEAWAGPSQTLPGSLVEGISQVAVPYAGSLRLVRGATAAAGLRGFGTAATAELGEQAVIAAARGQTGRAALLAGAGRSIEVGKMAAEGIAAGALADFVSFSSWSPRLSDLAIQSDNPLFNNALTQYLASDENDSFLEGRLKNAIEGVFASGAIESIMGAARVVRAGQRATRIGTDGNAAMFAEHMKIRGENRQQIMGATGATPDEAELINMVIDASGMSRDKLSFARAATQELDEAGNPRRAAVDFYEDGKTVIRFFETADRTSPVHEVAHVIRRRVLDRRLSVDERFGITDDDIRVIEDYVGAREGTWDVAAEENWAQLFERFKWDGIAPNHRVAAVMERASDFMRSVYSRVQADELLRNLDPEGWAAAGGTKGMQINPEVRQVMNKLMSRGPTTVDEAVRVFTKARKRLALPARGDLFRATLANLDEGFTPQESVEAVDSLYREERLYQSGMGAQKPRTTDEGYPVQRGSRAVIDRLRREVSQNNLPTEEADRMQKLIEAFPPELLEAMGTRFRKGRALKGGKNSSMGSASLGEFNFGRSIVTIASDLVRGTNVQETWSHEWGHAISSFLDDAVIADMKRDYTRSYQKFVRLEGIDPRAKTGTPEFEALKKWAGKNPARWTELYGLTSMDEWMATGFQTAAWRQLDIQEGTRSFIGFARYAFHNLMLNIKSIWGGAVHERIARDLLDADFRASKKAKAALMQRLGLGKLAPRLIAQEQGVFGDWETYLQRQLDQREKWMFKDFDRAEQARSMGEVKSESLMYRGMNRMDESLESRAVGQQGIPKAETKAVTLFQSMQPGSPEYTKALEGTKALDESGAPIKVFHGTPNKGVKELDPAAAVEVEGATWFSDNTNVAEQYRYEREYGEIVGEEAGDLIEANLVLRNPLEVDYKGKVGDAMSLGQLVKKAKDKGHDGLIVRNVDDTVDSSGELGTSYAVFSKEQVVQLPKRETLFQSAQPPAQTPTPAPLSPQGGQPPQRPFNIENLSTAADVRAYHDIRLQELDAEGRVRYNSMDRADQVAAAERELMQVADFTGYRTLPQLTDALRQDEDALQGFMSRHLATRMMMSEAAGQLIQAREAAMVSGAKEDMARFIAMQQRVDVLVEHTRKNQAAIARSLGSQSIVPGPGLGVVRLVDEAMVRDPQMVDEIIAASGGEDAVRQAMARSRAAEVRGGQAGALRATQSGRHGIIPVLTEYWMNSILSGPMTFAVNATSNATAMLYAPLEQALGAGLDKNFPLMRESMMRYGAILSELRDAMSYAYATLKTGDNILDQAAPNSMTGESARRTRAISAGAMGYDETSRMGAFVNFLGTVVNAPTSALGATDEFFKQLNYRSTVKAGLMADAMGEVAAGRLTRDQMGLWVEERFTRMVDQGQFYSERKIRADANNAAQLEISKGNFTQGSAEHLQFVRDYRARNWDPSMGALANRAREIAREATFTRDLRSDREGIEGMSAKVQLMVSQHPSLRILIPFVRTPANLLLYFGQRTPITGVMYATPGLNRISTRFSRDIASGDPVRRAQAIGRISTGSVITMSAIVAAATGVITGSGPKDPEERAYLMKAGWQPYSVKVGNTYISYRKMDPFASFFGIAADLHEAYANADDAQKSALEVTLKGLVAAVANNIANKTYLTGIVTAANAVSDAERHGGNWLEQMIGSFVPSALAQSQQVLGMDDAMRDVQTISDAIRQRIPGLSDNVAPKRDILGEPLRRPKILGAVPIAWPFAYTQVTNDKLAKELASLGAGFTPPRSMRNDVDLRSYTKRNGQNAYDRWQELTGKVTLGGQTLREQLERMIETPEYQRLDPTSVEGYESPRVGMIRSMVSRYRDAAFRETMQEYPDLMEAERGRRATVVGASSGKPFSELLQYSRER
jgi:hypothetical protein